VDSSRALQFAQQASLRLPPGAYQKISQMMPEAAKAQQHLLQGPAYTQKEAENETLGTPASREHPPGAVSEEQATFTGQGGVGQKSFSQQTAGNRF